ncbi:MAG: hypothetical protein FWG97_04900 [Deltaproteobacteria bacterium]|nr:hypothetical protein [Deltaproteobacteria bacterium]
MSEKKDKATKAAAPATASTVSDGVAPKIISELERVHMRQPKYEGMSVTK